MNEFNAITTNDTVPRRPLAAHWKLLAMLALMLAAIALPLLAGEKTAQEIIEKVQGVYDDMDNIVVTFSQKVRFKVSRAEQQTDGVLYFKKRNRYRIETEQRVIVTDGVTSWSYNPQGNQVFIDRYKETPGAATPDQVLLRYPKDYYSSLLKDEKLGTDNCKVLKLTPKEGSSGAFTGMRIWVNGKWLIRKVEMTDRAGTITTYAVKDIVIDKGIPDAKFQFSIPKGAEVVDFRDKK
jgi:outer membrane lipoprotein carrier protein